MKRYLVVSDSHTNRDCLVELVSKYQDNVDKMFHCGDSQLMADDMLWDHFTVVKGNCDFGSGELVKESGTRNRKFIEIVTGHEFF